MNILKELLKLQPALYGGQFCIVLGLIEIFDGWRKSGLVTLSITEVATISSGAAILLVCLFYAYKRADMAPVNAT